jgi:hypothetical protein
MRWPGLRWRACSSTTFWKNASPRIVGSPLPAEHHLLDGLRFDVLPDEALELTIA